jgi:hypothetical protein
LHLKDVTVCAADCIHADLAARALEICLDKVSFADAVLFSDQPVPGRFRSERIEPLRSSDDYSRFCLHDLVRRTNSKFVLVAQWDGYVVDPTAWRRDFARYDYLGAPGFLNREDQQGPWTILNGGFSLRSRRLLEATAALPFVPGVGEDVHICRTFRQSLERDGIRFPPQEIASRFAYQQRVPDGPTFGFHGLYNLHRVEGDDAIIGIVERLTPKERTQSANIFSLMHFALRDGRVDLARRLYALARNARTPQEMVAHLQSMAGASEGAQKLIDSLEALGA